MRGSNSKVLQISSTRQRRVPTCSQNAHKTPAKRSVSPPNCCEGHRKRGAPVFFDALNMCFDSWPGGPWWPLWPWLLLRPPTSIRHLLSSPEAQWYSPKSLVLTEMMNLTVLKCLKSVCYKIYKHHLRWVQFTGSFFSPKCRSITFEATAKSSKHQGV